MISIRTLTILLDGASTSLYTYSSNLLYIEFTMACTSVSSFYMFAPLSAPRLEIGRKQLMHILDR